MSGKPNGPEDLNLLKGLKTAPERLKTERAARVENAKHILSFGIPFLDEALGGIFRNDLIILGAKSGKGKSQLAMLIALENVRKGKKVHFLALEAEEAEIERRLKYQLISDKFYKSDLRGKIHLNYLDWYCSRFESILDPLEKEVEDEFGQFEGLSTFYRDGSFTAKDFERIALAVKDDTDLIIVDHLHYFDSDDENENRAIKDTVKKIRDCALISAKPVILIAHMRKTDRKLKQLVPDLEDFHGSSDIGKIATKAITIAPNYESDANKIKKTYIHLSKCRVDGSRTYSTGICAFNLEKQRYEREYYLGNLSPDGTELALYDLARMPFWAVNGKAANSRP
jgi:replicative DNA helicase